MWLNRFFGIVYKFIFHFFEQFLSIKHVLLIFKNLVNSFDPELPVKGPVMKKSVLRCCIILILATTMGCSSVLTYLGPLKSELKDGETTVGDLSHYQYGYHAIKNTITLKKIPMCDQMRQKLRVMQKQRRGLYMALLEMPFFGLGLFDMLRSYAIVDESRRVLPLAKYPTGETVQCGKEMPAADESLIIKNEEKGIEVRAKTDPSGEVDLSMVLPEVSGAVELDPA